MTIARCDSPGCEWSAVYQVRPSDDLAQPCEVCGGSGWVACWGPGGPCPPGQLVCDTCGPCLTCRVLLLCEDHAAPFLDLPTLRGFG